MANKRPDIWDLALDHYEHRTRFTCGHGSAEVYVVRRGKEKVIYVWAFISRDEMQSVLAEAPTRFAALAEVLAAASTGQGIPHKPTLMGYVSALCRWAGEADTYLLAYADYYHIQVLTSKDLEDYGSPQNTIR